VQLFCNRQFFLRLIFRTVAEARIASVASCLLGKGVRQRFAALFTAEKMVRAYVDWDNELSQICHLQEDVMRGACQP
jgi:hypothetical protein